MTEVPTKTVAFIQEAATEGHTTRDEIFTWQHIMTFRSDKGNLSCKKTLKELLAKELVYYGQVDLVKISLAYQFTGEKQSIYAGVTNANMTADAMMAAGLTGGMTESSNPMTFGKRETVILSIEDRLTKQVQPDSPNAMPFRLHVEATAGTRVWLTFYLRNYGPRTSMADF